MDRMLVFSYEKMADPSLQSAAVDLFRSVCKEGGQTILQNPDFASEWLESEWSPDRLLQQHIVIPSTMHSSDQCTVGVSYWGDV